MTRSTGVLRSGRTQRGSALPLVLSILFVSAALVLGVALVGGAAVGAARVASVADMTALAVVGGGDGAGERVAHAAGAELISIEDQGPVTRRVVVGLGGQRATAAATRGD